MIVGTGVQKPSQFLHWMVMMIGIPFQFILDREHDEKYIAVDKVSEIWQEVVI